MNYYCTLVTAAEGSDIRPLTRFGSEQAHNVQSFEAKRADTKHKPTCPWLVMVSTAGTATEEDTTKAERQHETEH